MKRIWILGLGLALVLTAIVTPASAKDHSEWSTPINVGPVVNTSNLESCPFVTKDGLSLYFASNMTGGLGYYDLYVSRRTSTEQAWGTPQNLGLQINTETIERCPYVTPDGRHLIFIRSDRPFANITKGDFYMSSRTDVTNDLGWGVPVKVDSGLNTADEEFAVTGYEDKESGLLRLYFASGTSGIGNGYDIYTTAMAEDGSFGPRTPVPELSGAFDDGFPTVRSDGLEMFLNSNRTGTLGANDIWVSSRRKTSDPWSTPLNIGPVVNGAGDDSRPALSWDGSTIIYASTRPGGFGSYDLWTTTRSKQKAEYTFTTIDPPGAKGAWAYDVGPGGEVVGNYQSADGKSHGFALRGGKFTTLDYPRNDVTMIRPGGIAPSGDIAGFYSANESGVITNHGFLLTKKGQWSTVDYPGQPNTVWSRILPDGTLIGNHFPMGGGDTGDMRAVVMSRSGNTELDVPCTTYIGGTPDGKVLVGYYREGPPYTGSYRAYVIDNGVFTGFVYPGAGFYCAAWDISSDGGTIVGTFFDVGGVRHGYIAERRGASVDDWEFTQFDVPGAKFTAVYGCNAAGDLVGTYGDAAGTLHGFLASRTGGN